MVELNIENPEAEVEEEKQTDDEQVTIQNQSDSPMEQ